VVQGQVSAGKVLLASDDRDISGVRNITSNGEIVAESFAGMFIGDGSGITGVSATSVGTLSGISPLALDGENIDDLQTIIQVEEPSEDAIIIIPNNNGTMLTTGNDNLIDAVGTIANGVWQGDIIQDEYVSESLTLNNGTINGTAIGSVNPDSARVTHLRSVNGISLGDGSVDISPDEIGHIDGVIAGEAEANKVLIPDRELSITGLSSMTIEDNFFSAFVGIDNIVIDGSSIGHSDDEDLVTLSDGNVIVSGNMGANNVTASGTITTE
jgi:hypothetical protein